MPIFNEIVKIVNVIYAFILFIGGYMHNFVFKATVILRKRTVSVVRRMLF